MNFMRKESVFFIPALGSVVLFFLSGGIIFFGVETEFPLVLHFDALNGIDLWGTDADVWQIWGGELVAICINFALAYVFYYRERLLTYAFVYANVLLALFTLIFSVVVTSAY